VGRSSGRATIVAVDKALITVVHEREEDEDGLTAARRFDWRHTPREVVDNVLADHRSS
jgi:hypothetical protein